MTVAIFAPTLGYPPVYEDTRDASLLSHGSLVAQLEQQPFRALSTLSHAVTRQVFGIEAWAFHLGSLLIHLVNVALWLAVLWLVVPPWVAVVAAAVFAWHPLQVEAVVYVSSRAELVATTGLLLALLAASLGSLAGALVGLVCAALGKETALVAWALVPLWAAWTHGPFPVKRYLVVGALGAVVAVAAVSSQLDAAVIRPSLELAGTQLAVIGWLVALVFVPMGLTIDHDWASLAWLWPVAVVVTAGLVAWACTVGWETRSPWALAVLWTLVALSPRLVVPLYEGLHEHHMLIPMLGWSVVIATAVTPRKGAQ